MKFTLFEVIDILKKGNYFKSINVSKDLILNGFSSIYNSKSGTISWMKSQDIDFTEIKADVILCEEDYKYPENIHKAFIPVENPRFIFALLLNKFTMKKINPQISMTATIEHNVILGDDVFIGHNVYIGENVSIGNNTKINHNVVINDNTIIGENCIIHSGAVIGSDGFGYEKGSNGEYFKILHIGGVEISDFVEIGSNTCIDKGTIDNTFIGNNTKIDNLCHIGHNVKIKENCMIIAQSMVGGSTIIEDNTWVAPSASLRDGLIIRKNSVIGLGAVVVRDVDENTLVLGVPARKVK